MTAAILIAKLLEVEKSIGRAHHSTLRNMVLEAQGCVLEMEQQMIETLRENGRLRERMEKFEHTATNQTPNTTRFSQIAADLSRALGRKPVQSERPSLSDALPEALA